LGDTVSHTQQHTLAGFAIILAREGTSQGRKTHSFSMLILHSSSVVFTNPHAACCFGAITSTVLLLLLLL
jgi:hypothetical protein